MSLATLLGCLLLVSSTAGSSWSYSGADGPDYWADTYSDCGLTSQSPIDIDPATVTADESLGSVAFSNYDVAPSANFTLANNGHTAQLSVNTDTISISGGGLDGTFILEQFHLHWGNSDASGSEHTVDGSHYDAEIHFVHYRNTYSSVSDAATNADGLAVLAFFLEEGDTDSAGYADLVDSLTDIIYKDNTTSVAPVAIEDFLPSGDLSAFYRYNGSLTTPGCYESVVWTVYKEPISISTSQMSALWALVEDNDAAIEQNYRPTQDLNGRMVYDSGSSPLAVQACFVALVALIATFY